MDRQWLTVKQAAEVLQITPQSVYKLIRDGKLVAYSYAGTSNIRLKLADLFHRKDRVRHFNRNLKPFRSKREA